MWKGLTMMTGSFVTLLPLLIVIVGSALIFKKGWRMSWPISLIGWIPLLNLYVIYLVGKKMHERIDDLEQQLSAINDN